MVGVTGGGKLLGEWKLIRASAFWGLLARMASALKIKCPTLNPPSQKNNSCTLVVWGGDLNFDLNIISE